MVLADGSTVRATTGSGLLVAWWPGSQSITAASVTTATATSNQSLDVAGPGLTPPVKPAPGVARSSSGSSGQSTVCLVHSCQ